MSIVGIEDAVNAAVWARLDGDATLDTLAPGGIHDESPQPPVYPWVQIGETVATKDAVFERDGRNVLQRLHVWSQYAGSKECADIMARIGDLLDEYELAVSGGTVESCEVEQTQILRDPDGITRHGVIDLRVRVAE